MREVLDENRASGFNPRFKVLGEDETMPVRVRLRCSECETLRDDDLKMEDTEITCPACGRRMANLQQNEYVEIESQLKKQQLFSIVSIVVFAIAIILLIMAVVPHSVPGAKADSFSIDWVSGSKSTSNPSGLIIAAGVCGLIAMVLAVFASLKRYIIEF